MGFNWALVSLVQFGLHAVSKNMPMENSISIKTISTREMHSIETNSPV